MSEPISSDLAVSSESREAVGTVELPATNPESISECQGVVESPTVLQEGVRKTADRAQTAQIKSPATIKSLRYWLTSIVCALGTSIWIGFFLGTIP